MNDAVVGRLRRRLSAIVLSVIVVAAAVAAALAVPAIRSAAAFEAARAYLGGRWGLELVAGDVHIAADRVEVDGLAISDSAGKPLFSAARIDADVDRSAWWGRSDRAVGLRSLTIVDPVLRIERRADGTYNLPSLGEGPGRPGASSPSARFTLTVRGGSLTFEDPTAPARAGRSVTVGGIEVSGAIDRAGSSSVRVRGAMGARPASVIDARYDADARTGFSQASLRAARVAIAPIVDGLVPTSSFVVEDGTASDVSLALTSIEGDAWRSFGTARIEDAKFVVAPLRDPVTRVRGPVAFAGGFLSTPGLSGTLEGAPIAVRGGLRVLGGVRLGLSVASTQDLSRLKHAFAFARSLDMRGDAGIDVRVDGPPATLDVVGAVIAGDRVWYAGLPLDDFAGTIAYAAGDLTIPTADTRYDGATLHAGADIDLTQPTPAARIDVAATMPGSALPVVANVNPGGTARALVEFDGPLASMEGTAFADVTGGDGVVVRTAVDAGPTGFVVGPAIVSEPDGGEMMLRSAIDRTTAVRTVSGDVVARDMHLDVTAGSYFLPGVDDASPVVLPEVHGTIAGSVVVRGDERSPGVGIALAADGLAVSGVRLGHAAIVANGAGDVVRIARLSIDGPDATVDAAGAAAIAPAQGKYAALLHGTGRVALAAMGGALPWTRASGTASGPFSLALADRRWTVSLQARGDGASVGGVGVAGVAATLGGGGGAATDVYAADARLAGGEVAAMGTMPSRTGDGDLRAWTPGIDLRTLRGRPMPIDRGTAIIAGRFAGTTIAPRITAAADLSGGSEHGLPLSGDVDLGYAGARLSASDGDVALGRSFAHVSGWVAGVGLGGASSGDALALDATMREGDLGSLAGGFLPPDVKLAGTVGARLRVRGTVGAPDVAGTLDADTGTLNGVAFDGLQGAVDVRRGAVQVARGAVALGSSRFAFSGDVSPAQLHLRASSAALDLSDFNDFFAGYDTLEGRGSGEVAFQTTKTGVQASGRISVRGADVQGYPLGSVDAAFASRSDELLATMRQSGDAGSSDLSGSVTLGARRTALPDLAHARYDISGSVTGLDIGRVAPIVGHGDLGLSGLLDAYGSLRGDLRAPSGHATFSLRDGHIGKIAVDSAAGTVDTDGARVALSNASVRFPFAAIDGGGTIGPGKRIAAQADVNASDLGAFFALFGRPGVASGSARAIVSVAGTQAAPRVTATVASGKGTAFGVAFDAISGKVVYSPGEIDVADAEVDLSRDRGVLTIGGTLPLELEPFGLGPKDKPVALTIGARGVDLSAFSGLTAKYATLSGTLDALGTVSGTAGRPQLAGSAKLRRGGVSSRLETVDAQNVSADLKLEGDTLTLSRLTGDLGHGTFSATGSTHIIPAEGLLRIAGLSYWTRVTLRQAQLDVPGWVSGDVSGTLRLTKSGTTPFLSGDVTLDPGEVPFSAIYLLASGYGSGPAPESGSIPGVPVLQPGHIVVYGGPVFGDVPPQVLSAAPGVTAATPAPELPSVDLQVTADAGHDVRVHGGAIDLTASGGVAIGGNVRAPTLAGTFSSTRGQIGYFDTNFRLVRGFVTFDPSEGLLPTLDVKAITNLSGVEITLTVTGRVDNLQTDLSSVPSMTRDEIVATLLHAPQLNSVIGAPPSSAQSQLYAEAQNYFNAQLTRSLLFPVESMIAQTINVEQISLIFDQQSKVDVEIRKLITPTVYAIYRSSLSIPVTQTEGVAYSLRDYADLEILQTQSQTGLQQSVLNLHLTFH